MNNIIDRTIFAVILCFIITAVSGPFIIPILHKLKFGQNIRGEGPKSHIKKSGTPTIGGIMFLLGLLISSIFTCSLNKTLGMMLFMTFGFGLIGFADDLIKIKKKRSLGLTASQKLIAQFFVAAVFAFYSVNAIGIHTDVIIPFMKTTLDLKWTYVPIIIFIIVATVNSVNLTDGLDGLASSVTLVVCIFLIIAALGFSRVAFSSSYRFENVDLHNIIIFMGALGGGLLGFLLFNSHPAKIFMGDTGSLALGGAVSAAAVFLKIPVLIILIGLIYLCESLSVIIQVTSFKLTGKRVFKMSPIHHHFELCGWSETRIVALFSIVTALACMVALVIL